MTAVNVEEVTTTTVTITLDKVEATYLTKMLGCMTGGPLSTLFNELCDAGLDYWGATVVSQSGERIYGPTIEIDA